LGRKVHTMEPECAFTHPFFLAFKKFSKTPPYCFTVRSLSDMPFHSPRRIHCLGTSLSTIEIVCFGVLLPSKVMNHPPRSRVSVWE
jgi:hypothetical protein